VTLLGSKYDLSVQERSGMVFQKGCFLALYNHDHVLQRKDRCFTGVDAEFDHTLKAPDHVDRKRAGAAERPVWLVLMDGLIDHFDRFSRGRSETLTNNYMGGTPSGPEHLGLF
jgi:hypothetical protein